MDDFTKFLFQTGLIVDIGEELFELNPPNFYEISIYDEDEDEDENIMEDDEEDY